MSHRRVGVRCHRYSLRCVHEDVRVLRLISCGSVLIAFTPALVSQERILWRDPGSVGLRSLNGTAPFGGPEPRPPYRFVKEDLSGSSPKVIVHDAASVEWRVKGGYEVKAETFATRLVSALGYYAQPTWYVERGRIDGLTRLRRAAGFVRADGSFVNAAFERRDPHLRLLVQDWAWNYNPFQGTSELQGLKVLVMLLSNWDNKDARNRAIGSNTGILEQRVNGRSHLIYFVNDWGQTLGAWGTDLRPKGWDCAAFASQTANFVLGRDRDYIRFGFVGLHTDSFRSDITVQDVRWLLRYLDPITEAQIRQGLIQSWSYGR